MRNQTDGKGPWTETKIEPKYAGISERHVTFQHMCSTGPTPSNFGRESSPSRARNSPEAKTCLVNAIKRESLAGSGRTVKQSHSNCQPIRQQAPLHRLSRCAEQLHHNTCLKGGGPVQTACFLRRLCLLAAGSGPFFAAESSAACFLVYKPRSSSLKP